MYKKMKRTSMSMYRFWMESPKTNSNVKDVITIDPKHEYVRLKEKTHSKKQHKN